jgi:hypothetical protein
MHIYTHIVLAGELEYHLKPDNPAEYYLGAVIPDVRYLTGITRQQTHLNAAQIMTYLQRYPHLKSFLMGYLVHCEIDLLDLTRVLFERTPLRLLRKLRQIQLAGILIESHYLEQVQFNPSLAQEGNEMLDEIGIDSASVHQFAAGTAQFLQDPSFQTELAALQSARILENPRARAYFYFLPIFDRSRWLRKILFASVPVAGIANNLPAILLASPVFTPFRD